MTPPMAVFFIAEKQSLILTKGFNNGTNFANSPGHHRAK